MSEDKIPREILRWLQSLDLAYAIKNPRRDFANGFLIAEIFYRYYVKAIQMHSFDNGISLKNRVANWSVLRKFFKKQRIPINNEDIDNVLYSRPGKVVATIKKIYSFLTQRKVKELPKNESSLPAPPFMKPTAAQAIRETLGRGGDQIDDRTEKQSTVRAALDSHNEMLANTRTIDANRTTSASKILKGETRKIVQEKERPQVVVRKVQVKSIDRSIAQLRAKQAAGNQQTSVLQASPRSLDQRPRSPLESVQKKFDDAVRFALGPENADILNDREDAAAAFVERVDSANPLDDGLAVRVLRDAFGSQLGAVADNAVFDPREFHRAFHILSVPLRLHGGPVFEAACDVLAAFGEQCAARDPQLTKSLFVDLAIGVIVRVAGNLDHIAQKHLIRVCAAFVGRRNPQHRLELFKCCRDALYANNDTVLLSMLGAAAEVLEGGASAPMPQELLDLYVLYCRGGLTAAKPDVRQRSVALLRHIVGWCSEAASSEGTRAPIQPVIEMVPALNATLSEGDSAGSDLNLQTECIHTVAVVLAALEPGEVGEDLEEQVWPIVRASPSAELRAHRLSLLVPHSVERGVDEMLKLDAEQLGSLLNSPNSALHSAWNPAEVSEALADIVVARRQENLDEVQVNMLASVATQAAAFGKIAGPDMEPRWIKVLDKIGKYIFVGLTDPVLVHSAVEFLSVFLLSPGTGASLRMNVLERKHLVSSMMLLFRDGEVLCQDQVAAMLAAALEPGHAAAADVAAFVNSIEQYVSDPTESVQELLDKAQQFDEDAHEEEQE